MNWLLVGVLLFCVTHLFHAVLPHSRDRLVRQLGENAYRGVFSLIIVGALILIVLGWKSTVATAVYRPPMSPGPVPAVLVLIGIVLFVASRVPGNLKRLLRHPQMIGTLCWGVAHLLTNGDSRSVTLFGGLTVWAALEILLINRRDKPWQKPPPAAVTLDIITVLVGAAAFLALAYFHATLFGVVPIPA